MSSTASTAFQISIAADDNSGILKYWANCRRQKHRHFKMVQLLLLETPVYDITRIQLLPSETAVFKYWSIAAVGNTDI